MLDGNSSEAEDVSVAEALVRSWLTDDGRSHLGHALDRWATEDAVEEWYRPDGSVPDADEVASALTAAVSPSDGEAIARGAKSTSHCPYDPGGVTTVGGLQADGSCDALSALAIDLLQGTRSGAALVLNLLDFEEWSDPSPGLVETACRNGPNVLILDAISDAPMSLVSLPAPPGAVVLADPKGRRRLPPQVPAVALVVILLLALLTIFVLLW